MSSASNQYPASHYCYGEYNIPNNIHAFVSSEKYYNHLVCLRVRKGSIDYLLIVPLSFQIGQSKEAAVGGSLPYKKVGHRMALDSKRRLRAYIESSGHVR